MLMSKSVSPIVAMEQVAGKFDSQKYKAANGGGC